MSQGQAFWNKISGRNGGLYMIYEKWVVPARIAWKRFPGWQESFSVLTQKSMTSFFNHRGAYINIETKSTIMHS